MSLPAELQRVVDAHQIYEVLTRYCRALDRCDVDLFKDVYWSDAMDDHGVFSGNAHQFSEFMVAFAKKYYLATQHAICNVSYEIQGDKARTESYLVAYHRIARDPEIMLGVFGKSYCDTHAESDAATHDFIFGGRYLDRFAKRDGVWRMAERVVTMEWNIMRPSTSVFAEGHVSELTAVSSRDRQDPWYRAL
jgi:hypothetical protein